MLKVMLDENYRNICEAASCSMPLKIIFVNIHSCEFYIKPLARVYLEVK